MSLRAPLAKALHHGAAHDGVNHWWVQRVSAIALAPLAIWLLWQLLSLPDVSYPTVSAWIGHRWNPVLLCLTVLLATWHGWLGVQMVVEDYAEGFLIKTSLLLLSTFGFGLMSASSIYAVLRVALRSLS